MAPKMPEVLLYVNSGRAGPIRTNRALCLSTRPVLTVLLRIGRLPIVTLRIKKIRSTQKSRNQTVNNGSLIVTLPHSVLGFPGPN